MKTWLLLAANSLTDNIKNQPNKSYFKNFLCLIIIFFKLDMLHDFCCKSTFISILLRNIAVVSSSVLDTEVETFKNHYGDLFLQSLLKFINKIICSHPSVNEWVFAIPIVHLLRQHNSLNRVEWNEDPTKFKYAVCC